DKIPEGERSTRLTSIAGSLRRQGLTREAIVNALIAVNAQSCDPPLPDDEVRKIASSVSRYRPAPVAAESPRPNIAPPLIHPALYFEGGFASIGILDASRRGWLVMASGDDREKYELQQYAPEALRVPALVYDGLIDRWRTDAVERFLAEGSVASVGSVLAAAGSTVEDHLVLQRPEDAVIVAVWAVATYFFPLFRAFPRLNVNGERGSGKSKALEVIAAMAFNGLVKISPTPAVLYRLITPLRPTLCLDEVE